ncbi:MAG: hypothetical protein V4673_02550 [Pseudomonadota bacterium]
MPTLNEYLGGIFSSITDARVMADVQTVQVAEQYAKHDLLKHFSVPRMRISDIELTIPVAIEGLTERTGYQLDPIGNAEFKRINARELARFVGYSELPPIAGQKLLTALDSRIGILIENIKAESDVKNPIWIFADGMVADLFGIGIEARLHEGKFPDGYRQDEITKIAYELGLGLVTGIVDKPVLDQLAVIAESHRLREQRPEDVIRIRMKVSEDGMEWQTLQRDDGTLERKLLPE